MSVLSELLAKAKDLKAAVEAEVAKSDVLVRVDEFIEALEGQVKTEEGTVEDQAKADVKSAEGDAKADEKTAESDAKAADPGAGVNTSSDLS